MIILTDGDPMVTVGAVLSTVTVVPLNGKLLTDGETPLELFITNCTVPSPLPVFTVTVQLVPLPLTPLTLAPLTDPVVVTPKSALLKPLTDAAKVAV